MEYQINSVLDILKLEERQLGGFLADLTVWYFACKQAEKEGLVATGFVWVDDGNYGAILSVEIREALVGHENMADQRPA